MPFEVISGRAVNPGAGGAALTMNTGDSAVVRRTDNPKLLNMWYLGATAGFVSARSVLFHDAVRGIRLGGIAASPQPVMPYGLFQPLQSQDTMTLEIGGGGAETDFGAYLMHYDKLFGTEGRFIDEATLRDRAIQPFVVENTLALDTSGNYSGGEAVNAETDLSKADYDYALVGYEVFANQCLLLGWRGAETGNLRVGGPGHLTLKNVTREWFIMLSREYGLPMIPVFNAANKGGITIDGVQDTGGADPSIRSIFMQLTPEADKEAANTPAPSSRAPPKDNRFPALQLRTFGRGSFR